MVERRSVSSKKSSRCTNPFRGLKSCVFNRNTNLLYKVYKEAMNEAEKEQICSHSHLFSWLTYSLRWRNVLAELHAVSDATWLSCISHQKYNARISFKLQDCIYSKLFTECLIELEKWCKRALRKKRSPRKA